MQEEPHSNEPGTVKLTTAEWFAELDRLNELVGEPFMPDGREQPAMPPDGNILDCNDVLC